MECIARSRGSGAQSLAKSGFDFRRGWGGATTLPRHIATLRLPATRQSGARAEVEGMVGGIIIIITFVITTDYDCDGGAYTC